MHQSFTASNKALHTWAIGGMADYWMSAIIYSFLSLVFVTSYEMNPARVGVAMMLPRLVDFVVDPMMGRFSDNLHTRWGRRRPFIVATTVLGAILVTAIWWVPQAWVNDWRGFAMLSGFSIVLYANLGVFQMAHGALGYELSDDYQQRSKVQALRAFYLGIGSLGGGYTYWLAQREIFGQGHTGEINGFRCLSVVIAVFILVFGLIPGFACRERFENINRAHVSIWKALKATLTNRPFIIVLLMRFTTVLGSSLFGALAAYVCIYSVYRGDKQWFNQVSAGWNGIAGFILGWAMVPLAAPITRWLGKRRGIILCCGLMAISALLTPFYMRPGCPYLLFAVGLAFMPVSTVLGNLLASVMPDICDLDELIHGERREGLFTAVMAFMTKLESSLCIGLGGGLLALSGFNQHLQQQPQDVLDKMRLYAFTPLIVGALGTFAVACFFPLNRKTMDDVRAKLDERYALRNV